jgi:plasmid stabilization system protein ParE
MDFRVAPQAESDLDEIWYFLAIQSSSIDVADRVIDSITARFALLAGQPYIAVVGTTTYGPEYAVSRSETM